jgi:predicted dinucleotide-binding enzyme
MKIGIIGSGRVAQTLALGFVKHGHGVAVGTREPAKLEAWRAKDAPAVSLGGTREVAAGAEVIVLAVKGTAASAVLEQIGAAALDGKVVIDATNPIAEGPPTNGIVPYFTGPNDSLMERLQKQVPGARFVKAFNSVGAHLMVNPALDSRPTMFISGNDPAAKQVVTDVLTQFGWDAEDVGMAEGARAIEPLCQLWCAPGFLRGDWVHAFKMLRPAAR